MRFNFRPLSTLAAATVMAALTLGPVSSWADQRAGRRSGGGSTASGGSSGGGQRSGGGERVGTAVPRGDGGSRSGGAPSGGGSTRTAPAGSGVSGSGGDRSDSSGGETQGSRPRDGQPVVGRAEPRRGGAPGSGGGTIIVPGGYYGGYLPWGYGGLGFAGYYGGYGGYGGSYDPWFYGDTQYYSSYEDGALRLKVKPRDASVFVDGYFAGQVDSFDGVFQRLRLEPGPHRIEISADGYETLTFEIRVLPDRTTTYKGELDRIQ